jgi:hypothetical protein
MKYRIRLLEYEEVEMDKMLFLTKYANPSPPLIVEGFYVPVSKYRSRTLH